MIETIKAIAADMRHEAGLPSISIAHTALQNLVDSWAARLESITALSNQGEGAFMAVASRLAAEGISPDDPIDYNATATVEHHMCHCGRYVQVERPTPAAESDRRDAEDIELRYTYRELVQAATQHYKNQTGDDRHVPATIMAVETVSAFATIIQDIRAATQEQT